MKNRNIKGLTTVIGALLMALALSASANARSLRTGSSGSAVTGSLPGEVLWTYYEQRLFRGVRCPSSGMVGLEDGCNHVGLGDNILRLINPNGAANANLAGARTQTVCAMIYVFDDDEEMGECCGCPLSSAQLATFSVSDNLTSNWGISGPPDAVPVAASAVIARPLPGFGLGAIAIVAAAPNTLGCVGAGGNEACHGGCDPTNVPGYSVTVANNLLGSITHNQGVAPRSRGLTEIGLSDDGGGDPTNLIYLQNQCGALVGNGTGGGICNCPIE